jgi:hypothetical protein
MRRHFRDRKDRKQRFTFVAKEKYAGMGTPSSRTKRTRPPSLPGQRRPSGVQTPLRLPRLPIHLRPRRPKGSVISAEHREHKVPRMSTDKKVLLGIWAVFLMGVVYSLWISMQVIGCCGQK